MPTVQPTHRMSEKIDTATTSSILQLLVQCKRSGCNRPCAVDFMRTVNEKKNPVTQDYARRNRGHQHFSTDFVPEHAEHIGPIMHAETRERCWTANVEPVQTFFPITPSAATLANGIDGRS